MINFNLIEKKKKNQKSALLIGNFLKICSAKISKFYHKENLSLENENTSKWACERFSQSQLKALLRCNRNFKLI